MSFERVAPHYTWMENLLAGPRLQRSRVEWLEALSDCERVLIAGVGHGHFLRAAVRRFPRLHATCVDASAGMLARARRNALRAGARRDQLDFIHGELPTWRPRGARFDAIVTHFFLDCFPPDELGEVVHVLAASARPAAKWLLADFTVPQRGLARHRARAVHALMYAFFRRATRVRARRVTPPGPWLARHGFTLAGRRTSEWGLLQSDLWARGASAPFSRAGA